MIEFSHVVNNSLKQNNTMEAISIIAYPTDLSQVAAIKAVMKALKVKFELSKTNKKIAIADNEITNAAILESIELYEKR
jgi:hypothetical protein